jgi:hypothetical protein
VLVRSERGWSDFVRVQRSTQEGRQDQSSECLKLRHVEPRKIDRTTKKSN